LFAHGSWSFLSTRVRTSSEDFILPTGQLHISFTRLEIQFQAYSSVTLVFVARTKHARPHVSGVTHSLTDPCTQSKWAFYFQTIMLWISVSKLRPSCTKFSGCKATQLILIRVSSL